MKTLDKIRVLVGLVLSDRRILKRLIITTLIITTLTTGYTVLAADEDEGGDPIPDIYPI